MKTRYASRRELLSNQNKLPWMPEAISQYDHDVEAKIWFELYFKRRFLWAIPRQGFVYTMQRVILDPTAQVTATRLLDFTEPDRINALFIARFEANRADVESKIEQTRKTARRILMQLTPALIFAVILFLCCGPIAVSGFVFAASLCVMVSKINRHLSAGQSNASPPRRVEPTTKPR